KVVDAETGIVSFDLAELPDTGIGAALVKITRDDYGRAEGTEDATAADLAFVPSSPLTATDVQAAIEQAAAAGGGVLPLVTGEIASDQPVFVYGPDGSLIYAPVT